MKDVEGVNVERLRECLAAMVRMDSTNPTLGSEHAGAGEAEVADFVEAELRDVGVEVDRWDAAPGRPNVVGVLRGTGGGRSLMWNGHMDTVGVKGMDAPFDPVVREGRLFGRGSMDMKASLAAQLEAIRLLAASGQPLAGDVMAAFVADEEHASIGTESLVGRYRPDGAVVTEPTHMQLATAHKGFTWIEVNTYGRAAHGSRPDEGIDANAHMGKVIYRTLELKDAYAAREAHPLLGRRSLHVGQLEGGDEPSVYADECRMLLEVRTLPGDTSEGILDDVEAILEQLRREDATFEADAEVTFERHALETPLDAPIAAAVRESHEAVQGTVPEDAGMTYWTDAALLAEAGTETVVFGPVGEGLHTTEEYVDLASVEALTRILVETARRYCR